MADDPHPTRPIGRPDGAERSVGTERSEEAERSVGTEPPEIPVADGTVGAAVLALREGGVEVDASVFATLTRTIAAARA